MPLLIASTGSNLEAEIAGIIPEINPIKAANPEPINILDTLNTNSKSKPMIKLKQLTILKTYPQFLQLRIELQLRIKIETK